MDVTRVFFPDCAVGVRSGLCIGWVEHRAHTVCILAVVHLPFDPHQIVGQLQVMTRIRQQPLTVLGLLTRREDPDYSRLKQLCRQIASGPCIELTRPDIYSLPTCTLSQDGQPMTQDYHLILYNQSKILACRLPHDDRGMLDDVELSTSHSGPSASGDNDGGAQKYILKLETVLSVIQEGVRQLSALRDLDISMDRTQGGKSSVISRFVSSVAWMWVSVVTFFFLPFRSDFCCRLSQNAVFQKMARFTQTGCRILAKYDSLQCLLDVHSGADGRNTLSREVKPKAVFKSRCEYLRIGNLWAYFMTDMLLGVLLMWWIQYNNWPDVWACWIISTANTTAGSLQTLLQWLMGAPAGLKLNSALAHFLGQFFLYHVYLWIGYLSIIQPVLGWAIWCMSLTGCLGVSVILAVASDMVSMLTFHIYCFYVYAARIYRLQLTGLLALSRLFRGKKWNVLRKRVDTCHYDVDQLFIGTLLFTILLFLLPTTIMFYAVFTMLRLAVITLEGILIKTIDVLKILPTYSILLCLTGSSMLMRDVTFDLMRQPGEGHSKAVVMQVQHMGIYDAFCLSYEDSKIESSQQEPSASRNPVISLVMDLITGCLIYPWGLAQNIS